MGALSAVIKRSFFIARQFLSFLVKFCLFLSNGSSFCMSLFARIIWYDCQLKRFP